MCHAYYHSTYVYIYAYSVYIYILNVKHMYIEFAKK